MRQGAVATHLECNVQVWYKIKIKKNLFAERLYCCSKDEVSHNSAFLAKLSAEHRTVSHSKFQ